MTMKRTVEVQNHSMKLFRVPSLSEKIQHICVKNNCLKILDLLMVFLKIILVDIGTFDGKQPFLEQIIQISVIFISNKSISMTKKERHNVSLTSNISAKTWSNCTFRGRFEIVRTSRFQICPWFWRFTKICGSNRAKQNIQFFLPVLYDKGRFFTSEFLTPEGGLRIIRKTELVESNGILKNPLYK